LATGNRDATRILRSFGPFPCGAAILASSALVYRGGNELRLAVLGKNGEATVIGLDTETYRTVRTYGGTGGGAVRTELRTDYYVTFRFAAAGREYRQKRPVSETFYRGHADGRTFEFRYLPGDPETNRIDPDWNFWGIVTPALLALFFGGAGYLFHRLGRRLAAAAREDAVMDPR
jgi:hypothetical protein